MAVLSNCISEEWLLSDTAYYSVTMSYEKKSITLKEHVDGLKKKSTSVIASNRGWRASLIQRFCKTILDRKMGDTIVVDSNKEIMKVIFDPATVCRVYIAQKVVSAIKSETEAREFLELLLTLTEAETAFWKWKIAAKNRKAISAFITLYKGEIYF